MGRMRAANASYSSRCAPVQLFVNAQRPGNGDFLFHHRVVCARNMPGRSGQAMRMPPRPILSSNKGDAARRGADETRPPGFGLLLHHRCTGNKQSPGADEELSRTAMPAIPGVDLGQQAAGSMTRPFADDGLLARMQNPAGITSERTSCADHHRVPALFRPDTRPDVEAGGEEVDILPLPRLPTAIPNYDVSHFVQTHSFYRSGDRRSLFSSVARSP